jgi:multisubunit Na+/H+ antiporter MnhE subunit
MTIKDLWQDVLDNKEVILLLTVIWVILYEHFSLFILISGLLISILVVLFTDQFLLKGNYEYSYVIGYGTLIRYISRLIVEIYRAGIGVIPTIIKGDADVEMVRVETKLTDELLIDILANSITLTPGTVSVEKLGNQLLILNLNAQGPNEERRELLPLRLEKILLDYEAQVDGKA